MTAPASVKRFLPYGRQVIDDDDIAAVAAVLCGDYLTTGPTVDAFEAAFAARVDSKHAISCSSGTAALHLAALAAGIGPGDRVIVPTMTFLATANAVAYVGGEVVFADVSPATGLMTAETLGDALDRAGGEAKAVFPVHLGGQCADMDAVAETAARENLRIVEDACHVLGGTYGANGGGGPVGNCAFGNMTTFSLHPVKTITMGEGGVVTTNDDELATKLQRLRNHGMVRDADAFQNGDLSLDADGRANPWSYEMQLLGFNYRATDMQCALGESQLRKLDRFVAERQVLVDIYERSLAPLAPMVQPVDRVPTCRPAWHLFAVLVDFAGLEKSRATVMNGLREQGIGTQVHYIPVHRQPYYRATGVVDLPGADAYYERTLSLPLFPGMTEADVERVVNALANELAMR